MKKTPLFWAIIGLLLCTACHEKDLDMTVRQKTLYEGLEFNEITAEDAWCVIVLHDAEESYVELEYSAFLEDYMKVQLDGNSLFIGFTRYLNLPNNTVMNATIHTPSVQSIHFSDAVTAALDGQFPETALTFELEDAATCRGGHFYGNAELKLSDAATCVEFYFEGTDCKVELEEASVFKGSLNVSGDLTMDINEASRLTNYWGEINRAEVKVSDASFLNMATCFINSMNIEVNAASEATVNVVETLEGSVLNVSKLYFSGNPTLNVNCDETSIVQQVEFPNP